MGADDQIAARAKGIHNGVKGGFDPFFLVIGQQIVSQKDKLEARCRGGGEKIVNKPCDAASETGFDTEPPSAAFRLKTGGSHLFRNFFQTAERI